MTPPGTLLVLSRAAAEWRGGLAVLSDEPGWRILQARTEAEGEAMLDGLHVDVVLAEESPSPCDGEAFLARLQATHPDIVRVLVLSPRSGMTCAAMTAAGLYQVLRKPIDPQQLALTVRRGVEQHELTRRLRLIAADFAGGGLLEFSASREAAIPGETAHFETLIYVSETMGKLCALAAQAAATELPILIQGESGTGKQLLARALHFHSNRRDRPLIVQNCSAMAESFLEAELFGQSGALAPASDRPGLLRAAEGGTLFLDEIAELPRPLQLRLLQVLQTGEFKPVGADRPEYCDVRVIAASGRPLSALVAAGSFRQDLYFRLRGVELHIPPLRERPEDIPALAAHFTAKYGTASGRRILGISASALAKLAAHPFPGNVRELENEIRRMVALAKDGGYLTTAMMSPALAAAADGRPASAGTSFAPEGASLKEKIESLEKHLMREALSRHKWNRSRVAEELGLSRVGLANKIRRYGLNEQHGGSQ